MLVRLDQNEEKKKNEKKKYEEKIIHKKTLPTGSFIQ